MFEATEQALSESKTSTVGARIKRESAVSNPIPPPKPPPRQKVLAPVPRRTKAFPTNRHITAAPAPAPEKNGASGLPYFAGIPGELISPLEERNRIQCVRRQWATSQLIGLVPKVAKLAAMGFDPSGRQMIPVQFKAPGGRLKVMHSYQIQL
jgi:hypothetical protein